MEHIVLHKRTDILNNKPSSDILKYGELALNYAANSEGIFLKNSEDNIIEFKSFEYTEKIINEKVNKLITNTELKFYCIEPVTIAINGEETTYESNTMVDIFLKHEDE